MASKPSAPAEIVARLRKLDESLTCVEERRDQAHPPCDYCGEVCGGVDQRATVREAADLLASLALQVERLTELNEGERERLAARVREVLEAGIKLASSYGDNIHHLDGEQKERQWQRFLNPDPEAARHAVPPQEQ